MWHNASQFVTNALNDAIDAYLDLVKINIMTKWHLLIQRDGEKYRAGESNSASIWEGTSEYRGDERPINLPSQTGLDEFLSWRSGQ